MEMNNMKIVETPFGQIKGERVNDVCCFRRIPYAEPACGPNRFKLPTEPLHWNDVYDATVEGSIPPQPPAGTSKVMGDYPMSQDEDCLHLDIWTPSKIDSPKPVLIFIHGGAFVTGGGSLPFYDGRLLAQKADMVVVNISYRLGPLGFLSLPETPSNLGIHDQIAALKWIKKAIYSFGGNPENITVAGQSAGAFCVAAMLVNKSCQELFTRAILMSPPLGMKLRKPEQSTLLAAAMLRVLGLDPKDFEAFKGLPFDEMMKAFKLLQAQSEKPAIPGEFVLPFSPVIDDDLIFSDPIEAVREGAAAWCDTLIGATRDEFNAFSFENSVFTQLTDEALATEYERSYGDEGADRLAVARTARVPFSPGQLLADLRGNTIFNQPVIEFAGEQTKHGAKSFLYQFDWHSSIQEIGACHCIDLPFLFGQWDIWQAAPMVTGANKQELEDLSFLFQGALAEFARTGNPNKQGLPIWPEYAVAKSPLHFDQQIQYF